MHKARFIRRVVCLSAATFLLVIIVLSLYALFTKPRERQMEGDTVKLQLLCHEKNNEIIELGLEEYLVGVVAAEMPAAFPDEALKAQAVAARTYAVKRLQAPDTRIKAISLRADLSSDPAINQAWIDQEEMKKRWGLSYNKYRDKIMEAVIATRGQVILYGGQLIDPVYHASCGGKGTENSGEVWKYDIPYLRAVPCAGHPEGNKEEAVVFKLTELDRRLGTQIAVLPVAKLKTGGTGLKIQEKTASGRVKAVSFAGKTISGTEVRSRLGLKSTWFSWQLNKGVIKFSTLGYGHAVGMCQYGAKAQALSGKNYQKILQHYYTGVTLGKVNEQE